MKWRAIWQTTKKGLGDFFAEWDPEAAKSHADLERDKTSPRRPTRLLIGESPLL
jgi:hypothetical protein